MGYGQVLKSRGWFSPGATSPTLTGGLSPVWREVGGDEIVQVVQVVQVGGDGIVQEIVREIVQDGWDRDRTVGGRCGGRGEGGGVGRS